MTRKRSIVPSESAEQFENQDQTEASADPEAYETHAEEVYDEQYWEDSPTAPRGTWIAATLLALVAVGWTGFFAWVHYQEILAGAAPTQWIDWIVQWSAPMVLLVGVYLLVMRNSRREANRFTDAARALSTESAQLEARLLTVNRELALARDFIAAQSNDLESLGRIATERLSGNADTLQSLIRDNSAQVEAIGNVSDNAVSNLETLRDQLPVLTNAARDMSNQIGTAGHSAQGQIDTMLASFERLNELESNGQERVDTIRSTIDTTLAGFEEQLASIEELSTQRFGKLHATNDEFRRELESSEERVFDAIAARAEALSSQLANDAEAMREREATAASAMRERIVTLRIEGERLVSAIDGGQSEASKRWGETITALENRMKEVLAGVIKLDESATENARMRLVALNEEAQRVDQRLTSSMTSFEDDFAKRREANHQREIEAMAVLEEEVAEFDNRIAQRHEAHLSNVAGLTEQGEALAQRLGVLDAEMRALGSQAVSTSGSAAEAAQLLAERVSQSRAVLEENENFLTKLTDDSVRLLELIRSSAEHSEGDLSNALGKAEERLSTFAASTQGLHNDIVDAEQRSANIAAQMETIRTNGSASNAELATLQGRLASIVSESDQVATRTSSELQKGIDLLADASRNVLANLRGEQSTEIAELARQVSEASREKIAEALRKEAQDAINEIEDVTVRAQQSGEQTAQVLRDQLARVDELASNLEHRVEYAREKAEEQVDNDFSRRSALITEALNSSAIDIAKAFENDVGDSDWASYLRGDRGIFTRRAVRLLDKQDARKITEIYSEDSEFRETVNRYIHDFEAMLRGILATRDGQTMAVTMLSSDMGKLYVALAQGIERLRN